MTGQEFAQALPLPLVLASIVTCTAAIGCNSRRRYGWSDLFCVMAFLLLVLAALIAWSEA